MRYWDVNMSKKDPGEKKRLVAAEDPTAKLRSRGPLRSVILSATGQDVGHCNGCGLCDGLKTEEMDVSIGEVLQAANRNENLALTNRTLWNFDTLMEHGVQCQAGLDIVSILITLQREAELRGVKMDEGK